MATLKQTIEINPENQWRLETPGAKGWAKTARPGQQTVPKYFMVSCDTHLLPPPKLFYERIDARFRDLLPRMETRDGVRYMVRGDGSAPERLIDFEMKGEDLVRSKAGAAFRGEVQSEFASLEQRIIDQENDGVDAEILFPNGPAMMMWAGSNVEFIIAQCRIYNDWAIEFCRPRLNRCSPAAVIPTLDVDVAIAEIQRVAKLGFRLLTMPNKPCWGPDDGTQKNYNHPDYNRLWAAVQDQGLPTTFHAASGKDPRAAKGYGGAITNYVVHGCLPVVEPAVTLCSSGIIERFPKVRFGIIEGNAGFVPWMLDMMDEAHLKHYFWTRPRLKELPSTYFRTNGAVTVGEDRSALLTVEPYGLENNLLWANDYPHHEGSWPHSAEAIERIFGHLREETRAKILGENAARFFGFDIPPQYL
jgi:predicted TIM-barrel fold metal-dependent hydrolase